MSSILGWLATAVTAGSFLSRQEATLKRIQGAATCLWTIYGVNIDATSMIVANFVVAVMPFYSSFAQKSSWKQQWSARVSRPTRTVDMSRVVKNDQPNGTHTAMVVSTYLPGGVRERTSDLVMFRGGACDRVPSENIDFSD